MSIIDWFGEKVHCLNNKLFSIGLYPAIKLTIFEPIMPTLKLPDLFVNKNPR
jgi:hypothetical protein